MKIESFKINVAVAEGAKREYIANAMRTAAIGSSVVFGIEIEGERGGFRAPKPAPDVAEAPRQKRKYTRRAKPEAGGEQRVTLGDGATVVRRGTIPAGGNAK